MRIIGLLVLGLGLVGWAAVTIELGEPPSTAATATSNTWVRTVDGWEQSANWAAPAPRFSPRLHPLVVALGQVLFSMLALVAFPPRAPQRHSAAPPSPPRTAPSHSAVPQSAQHLAVRLSLLQR